MSPVSSRDRARSYIAAALCFSSWTGALFLAFSYSWANEPSVPLLSAPAPKPKRGPLSRDPYCPEFIKRLNSELNRLSDQSIASDLQTKSGTSSYPIVALTQKTRDAVLNSIKLHLYRSQPIEILESGINVKATYVARDEFGVISGGSQIPGASVDFKKEIETTLAVAESYPKRWNDLVDLEIQSRDRLKRLKQEIEQIKARKQFDESLLKKLTAKRDALSRFKAPYEIELPQFDETGNTSEQLSLVAFKTQKDAENVLSEVIQKLQEKIEFKGPYWIKLPAVTGGKTAPVPHSFQYSSLTDMQVAVKGLEKQLKTLKGNHKVDGSYLNTAAGQVVNLKEMEVIREMYRRQIQNFLTDHPKADIPAYLQEQIKRIDAILDPVSNKVKEEFLPPAIAFEKVKTQQFFNETGLVKTSLKDKINKPIRTRPGSQGSDAQDMRAIDAATLRNPPDKTQQMGDAGATPSDPISAAGTNNLDPPGGQNGAPIFGGTAGPLTPSSSGSGFSIFKRRNTPFGDRYDKVLSWINSLDPAVAESIGFTQPGMAMGLWKNGKLATFAGVFSTLLYGGGELFGFTPSDAVNGIISLWEMSDDKQIDLCAHQGATEIGSVAVNTDPNQNSNSDQQFQDCSIAFIKTKFVKDYLSELSKNDPGVSKDDKNDLAVIDPDKVESRIKKGTKGAFFKDKKTGSIYIRPELASIGIGLQPGVSFDPNFKALKINPNLVPEAGSQNALTTPGLMVEKDPATGKLLFHVDKLASNDNGIFFLNDQHQIVLAPKVNTIVEKLLQRRRKVMGYRNNQSNVESVLRQFLSTANPCSDPNYTQWISSKNEEEYKKGLFACVRFLYPRFMNLGDTEKLVSDLITADSKEQQERLKPLINLDATFGYYVCNLVLTHSYYATNTANNSQGYGMPGSTLTCQNLSSVSPPTWGWNTGGIAGSPGPVIQGAPWFTGGTTAPAQGTAPGTQNPSSTSGAPGANSGTPGNGSPARWMAPAFNGNGENPPPFFFLPRD